MVTLGSVWLVAWVGGDSLDLFDCWVTTGKALKSGGICTIDDIDIETVKLNNVKMKNVVSIKFDKWE